MTNVEKLMTRLYVKIKDVEVAGPSDKRGKV